MPTANKKKEFTPEEIRYAEIIRDRLGHLAIVVLIATVLMLVGFFGVVSGMAILATLEFAAILFLIGLVIHSIFF